MIGVVSLLIVLVLSILITRIAAVALTHTGLSQQSAKFQARSAITGVGFTTAESEKVVRHPVRRKILQALMLIGNAGIITAVSSLIVSFVDTGSGSSMRLRIFVLITGVVGLWLLAKSSFLESKLSGLISKVLRRSSSLEVYDYASMLHLAGEYRISEIGVSEGSWLCGKTLRESGLREEGVVILGITRKDGTFLGTPQPNTKILEDDLLIVYGRARSLKELEGRREDAWGNAEHDESMRTQDEEIRKEELLDKESQRKSGE